MLRRFNFPEKWRRWIGECLSTTTANVLVNGSPSGEFKLERGVRQGDPLSPFLFLVAAEGLNLLIKRAVRIGLIEAVEVGRNKVSVSHIQYADDTLFTVKGSADNAVAIKRLLKIFELISGLSVNFDKCCVYGVNLGEAALRGMAMELGCNMGDLPIPYLGMKVGGRLNGAADWGDLVERMKKKLRNWDAKNLSVGGRVTLINSVIAALPIYRLSFAQMPKSVASQVRSLQGNFLWGGNEGERKMAWIKWDTICKSKKEGGLGIRNLLNVNVALLVKWVWRFLGEDERLWHRVIKSRHGSLSCGREEVRLGDRGGGRTGWWGKVVKLIEGDKGKWFREKLKLRLGNGTCAKFWEGSWSGTLSVKERFPRLFQLSDNKDGNVAEMGRWVEGCWRWDLGWRRVLLEREKGAVEDLLNLLGNFKPEVGCPDRWQWGEAENGSFSVKLAYKRISDLGSDLTEEGGRFGPFKGIWKAIAPFKAQIMVWRAFWNRLPTMDNISKIFVTSMEARKCSGCKVEGETINHFFLLCTGAKELWDKMIMWVGVSWAPPGRVSDHFMVFSHLHGGKESRRKLGGLWICVVWVLWKWRNEVIFEGRDWDWKRIEVEVKCRFWSWCLAKGKAVHNTSFREWTENRVSVT